MKFKKIITLILMLLLVVIFIPTTSNASNNMLSGSSGGRNYYLYVPSYYNKDETYPLMVMLHGCLQSAEDFAEITNMNALAEQEGFLVLYPRQNAIPWTNTAAGCWQWFDSSHHSRGSGEPEILANMTLKIINSYNISQDEVYVAGISAGGAMAIILGSAYPDIYSGVGVHSGLQYGASTSALYSSYAMLTESYALNTSSQGQKAYAQMLKSKPKVMPTIVFHGSADATVRSFNGMNAYKQMITTNDYADDGLFNQSLSNDNTIISYGQISGGYNYNLYTLNDENNLPLVQYYQINGMNHAWSGGTKAYTSTSFSDPKGPNASLLLWNFFNINRHIEKEGLDVNLLYPETSFYDELNVFLVSNDQLALIYYSCDGKTYYLYEDFINLQESTTLFIKAINSDEQIIKEITFTKKDKYIKVISSVYTHLREGRITFNDLDFYLKLYGMRNDFAMYLYYDDPVWHHSMIH